MSATSDYLENKILDHVLGTTSLTMPTQVYAALNTEDPGEDGTGDEVTGGSYARQAVDFDAASSGQASNSAELTFGDMPAVTVTHVSLWDADTGGNMLYYTELSVSRDIEAGNTATIAIGDITVTQA